MYSLERCARALSDVMRVLITNDDGIHSSGLILLMERLRQDHDVWVFAPDEEKSGCSHSITLRGPTKIERMDDRTFMCGGTPADCVLLACLGMVPVDLDLVISGINLGPNLGTDIVYSGTAAGARQAALMGKPSIAVSLNAHQPPYELAHPAEFVAANIDLFRSLWSDDHFLNINFPPDLRPGAETAITFPTKRIYRDQLSTFTAPDGCVYTFLGGSAADSHNETGSDYEAVVGGKVSLSPVLTHPANHAVEAKYRDVRFRT